MGPVQCRQAIKEEVLSVVVHLWMRWGPVLEALRQQERCELSQGL